MKQTLFVVTLLLTSITTTNFGQTTSKDTTLLGVFSTGARFIVTRAAFGAQKPLFLSTMLKKMNGMTI